MFDAAMVARARTETPGCASVRHFNNAGAALMPTPVIATVQDHLQRELMLGGYEAAAEQTAALEQVYACIARLLGCAAHEIACVENATVAWSMAFYGIPFQAGDRILTSQVEYASNVIALLQVAQRTGAQIEVIPSDEWGRVSVEALRELLDERVKLIAITHVPTNGGLINPAAEIGALAREAGVLYLLDACQSAGQLPLDVGELGCDFLTATGRKFLRGPRGTGFLYVREALLATFEPPMLDLHAATWVAPDRYELRADARRFENWETNIAAKLGLGAAVEYALAWGLDAIAQRVQVLAAYLRAELQAVPAVTIHDQGAEQCGITTWTVEGLAAPLVQQLLAKHRINVSVSDRASTLFDMQARGLDQLVRASVHYYNTEAEIDQLVEVIKQHIQ